MANILHTSTKTAFTLRHKVISCLKSIIQCFQLNGKIELDEYYLSINLKGTKTENMPRLSKKRTSHGSNKRGISNHKICIKNTTVNYKNVCNNYSIFNFNAIYKNYNFHPSKTIT